MKLKVIEKHIQGIKQKLLDIGEMRPGNLSKQYNVCGTIDCRCKHPVTPKKHGPYIKLSYTRQGKSTSRFIRAHQEKHVKAELETYKQFRKLIDDWIELAVEQADIKLQATKDMAPRKSTKRPVKEK